MNVRSCGVRDYIRKASGVKKSHMHGPQARKHVLTSIFLKFYFTPRPTLKIVGIRYDSPLCMTHIYIKAKVFSLLLTAVF